MFHVLVLDPNKDKSMLTTLHLLKDADIKVYEKSKLDDAIDLIQIIDEIELIIIRDDKKNETSEKIATYLLNNYRPIKLFVIGKANVKYDMLKNFDPEISPESIAIEVKNEFATKEESSLIKREYISVPVDYFLNFKDNPQRTDIYLRIKKEDEFQYVKRVHIGEVLEREAVLKYAQLGLKEFFIKSSEFQNFIFSASDLVKSTINSDSLGLSDRMNANQTSYKLSQAMILDLGIDEHTIELVKSSITSMDKTIKDGALRIFLEKLKSNEDSFAYAHVYLISYLLFKVVDTFDWNSASVKEKLSYIAFFHDISLVTDEHLLVATATDLEQDSLGSKERNLISNHAIESARIVDQFPAVPMGVSSIIREHHGSKTGYGFPSDLSHSIAPLSMIFLVVEEFACTLLKAKNFEKQYITDVLSSMKTKYTKGTYLQALNALVKISNKGLDT